MRIDIDILRDNISKTAGVVPFILCILNLFGYLIMTYNWYISFDGYRLKEWVQVLFDINKQFCDIGLLGLVVIFITSRNFNKLSFDCLKILFAIWLLNGYFIIAKWEFDLYIFGSNLLIYTIFVICIIKYVFIKR